MLYNIKYARYAVQAVVPDAIILQLLKDHIDLLKENNIEKLYSLISNEISYVSDLTDYFIKYNIDFLKYVDEIPAECFKGCSITQIEIPRYITIIGEHSFEDTDLKEITIPGSVDLICEGAFQGCNELSTIKIEEGVRKIGDAAFNRIALNSTVYLPNSVIEIQPDNFYDDAIIFCPKGSYAEEWCKKNNISYEIID